MIIYPWFSDADFIKKVKEDQFNVNNLRNVDNSDKLSYNCAGYALQCFSWYMPAERSTEFRGWEKDEVSFPFSATERAVSIMLGDFPDLRRIQSLDEVRDNEYAILFRLSSDGDFHYIRQASNGHWFHKRGNHPYIDTIRASEIFKVWFNRYDGPIVILAKERK